MLIKREYLRAMIDPPLIKEERKMGSTTDNLDCNQEISLT